MTMNQLTIQRAKMVFELSSKLLMDDEGDDIQGEAYRFAFLVLRGPKSFKQAFSGGRLSLDKDKVYDGFWGWRFDIPGTRGLSSEEASMIDFHNQRVQELHME
jgi:hypothetical protein